MQVEVVRASYSRLVVEYVELWLPLDQSLVKSLLWKYPLNRMVPQSHHAPSKRQPVKQASLNFSQSSLHLILFPIQNQSRLSRPSLRDLLILLSLPRGHPHLPLRRLLPLHGLPPHRNLLPTVNWTLASTTAVSRSRTRSVARQWTEKPPKSLLLTLAFQGRYCYQPFHPPILTLSYQELAPRGNGI